jgi:YVTN family beta-propeller protein
MTTNRLSDLRRVRCLVAGAVLGLSALAAQAQTQTQTQTQPQQQQQQQPQQQQQQQQAERPQAPTVETAAYVTNQDGDISVIDLTTLVVTGTLPAHGKGPRGVGVTDDGKWLVVANREDGGISVIDRASGRLVRKVKVGANPEFVRVRDRLAFVSYEPSSTGGPPPKPGAQPPAHEEEDDDEPKEPARIAIVDLDRGELVRSITGGLETEGIEFSTDGRHILVTNEEDDTVTVHDIASGELVTTIDTAPHGKRPRGIKRSPDGKRYVATLEFGNAFIVIGPDYRVQQTVKTGAYPYGVAFDREGKRLYVASARAEALQVYKTDDWSHVKDVPTGKRCWHFSFTPDDRRILVACGRSHEVVVIDVETLEPVKRIGDLKLPWGVVTYPKSMGSLE